MHWNPNIRPLFWMHEQTGMMKHIVQKFFEKIRLTNLELKYLKWYIVQWIDGNALQVKVNIPKEEIEEFERKYVPKDCKKRLDDMDQEQIMKYVSEELMNFGFDPF